MTSADAIDETALWQCVVGREALPVRRFVYAVRSTGIYCRPGCPSRLPLRRNVEFYLSEESAEAAGYRPCLRCRPRHPPRTVEHRQAIEKACRLIQQSEAQPDLAALAATAGMSRFHFHRTFKRLMGVTPKAYADALRRNRVGSELSRSATVTATVYKSGFQSSSRFYSQSQQILGMEPSVFRRGGVGVEIRFAVGECSLGSILVAATARGVCCVLLGDSPEELVNDLEARFAEASLIGGDLDFEQWVGRAILLVEQPRSGVALPLDLLGTAFEQRVWEALRKIPAGTTVSYSELARQLDVPRGARAVARACASNAVAVAVPCHRVVRRDGTLSGYRWGIERKKELLGRERGEPATPAGKTFVGKPREK